MVVRIRRGAEVCAGNPSLATENVTAGNVLELSLPQTRDFFRVPPALAPKVEWERVNELFPKSYTWCPCHQLSAFSLDSDRGSKDLSEGPLPNSMGTHGTLSAKPGSWRLRAAMPGTASWEFGNQGAVTVDIKS